ncbi:MAG: helix-turn-helix domain-containing protein [Proteobacteria bacterium]|nr:helix-turn-helix domain-containing protein [Pseudomonadota bacterium]
MVAIEKSRMKVLWIAGASAYPAGAECAALESVCDLSTVEVGQFSIADLDRAGDVVCFDFDFPQMFDLAIVARCKLRVPSVPIVILAAQLSVDLALWALRSRIFDLLLKPVAASELAALIERLGSVSQARRSQSRRSACSPTAKMPVETRYRRRRPVNERLAFAAAYIAKNYSQEITEAGLATQCKRSASRFSTDFKAEYGVSFVDYLSSYRVMMAKRLLRNPQMAMADVAAAVGFQDSSYFSRVFRKHEQMTPSEYRSLRLKDAGVGDAEARPAEAHDVGIAPSSGHDVELAAVAQQVAGSRMSRPNTTKAQGRADPAATVAPAEELRPSV